MESAENVYGTTHLWSLFRSRALLVSPRAPGLTRPSTEDMLTDWSHAGHRNSIQAALLARKCLFSHFKQMLESSLIEILSVCLSSWMFLGTPWLWHCKPHTELLKQNPWDTLFLFWCEYVVGFGWKSLVWFFKLTSGEDTSVMLSCVLVATDNHSCRNHIPSSMSTSTSTTQLILSFAWKRSHFRRNDNTGFIKWKWSSQYSGAQVRKANGVCVRSLVFAFSSMVAWENWIFWELQTEYRNKHLTQTVYSMSLRLAHKVKGRK